MVEVNETHAIQVSNEAKLRWLQRVDPTESNPASRIRHELERTTATIDAATGALRWQTDRAVLITDDRAEVVKTVLKRRKA